MTALCMDTYRYWGEGEGDLARGPCLHHFIGGKEKTEAAREDALVACTRAATTGATPPTRGGDTFADLGAEY